MNSWAPFWLGLARRKECEHVILSTSYVAVLSLPKSFSLYETVPPLFANVHLCGPSDLPDLRDINATQPRELRDAIVTAIGAFGAEEGERPR